MTSCFWVGLNFVFRMFQFSYRYEGNPTFQDTSLQFFFSLTVSENARVKHPHSGHRPELSDVWNKRHLVGMRTQSLIEFALRSILLWEAVPKGFFFKLFSMALNKLYTSSTWKTKQWLLKKSNFWFKQVFEYESNIWFFRMLQDDQAEDGLKKEWIHL